VVGGYGPETYTSVPFGLQPVSRTI